MSKNFHATSFDAGTREKLTLYRDYLREWLPVFLKKRDTIWNTVNIFDFFAGPGQDADGQPGSPLVTLAELVPYSEDIRSKGLHVNLYLNEVSPNKCQALRKVVSDRAGDLPVEVHISEQDFSVAFDAWYSRMQGSANLLFLDQQGVKQVTESIFSRMVSLPVTDFLFFIASSFIRRFSEHEAFCKYVNLSRDDIEERSPNDIHRLVLEYYRSLVPDDLDYFLASFSIRKKPNIYGLIFGSRHWLGIRKFLTKCWEHDPERGEANFDIDDDQIHPDRPYLFPELNRPKKLDAFKRDLIQKVSSGDLKSNRDVFLYTLSSGFLPKHAREVIKELQESNRVAKGKLPISNSSMSGTPIPIEWLGRDPS